MDGKGLRALLCVLVVIGCSLGFVSGASSAAVVDSDADMVTQHTDALEQVQEADEDDEDADETETDDADEEQEQDQEDEPEPDQQTGSDRLNDADEIHIDVFVHENGSATFVVDYRFENNSDSNWQSFREDVENNTETYAAAERDAWNETIADGANATEREMEIRNLSIATDTSSAPHDLGHVKVRFEWTEFAYVELTRLEVSDALRGLTLLQDTTMQVFPPDGYVINNSDGDDESSEDSVFWHGDSVDFASDPPSIVMIQNGNTGEPEPEAEAAEEGPTMPWLVVLAALALLALVGATGWLVRDRELLGPTPDRQGSPATDVTPTDQPQADSSASEPPPELLSNEERVLRLLATHGGRIKQQEVISELDWTEAKTSQVVSGLREDAEIEVFRIGRENVLALPDDGGAGGGEDRDEDGRPGTADAENGP